MTDSFAREHRACAPPVTDDDALARIHAESRARASARAAIGVATPRAKWYPRVAATAIALALAAGGFAYSLAPKASSVAFARERAAAALAAPAADSIWHVVFSGGKSVTGEVPHQRVYDEWSSADGKRVRRTALDAGGKVMSDQLIVDHRLMSLELDDGSGRPLLVDTHVGATPSVSIIAELGEEAHKMIASGKAKVVGTKVVDGQPCWVVSWKTGADSGAPGEVITVELRKPDYRPLKWEARTSVKEGAAGTSGQVVLTVKKWEYLAPSAVPSGTFSFDGLKREAPAGTQLKRANRP
jgi:hypothetical protein